MSASNQECFQVSVRYEMVETYRNWRPTGLHFDCWCKFKEEHIWYGNPRPDKVTLVDEETNRKVTLNYHRRAFASDFKNQDDARRCELIGAVLVSEEGDPNNQFLIPMC